MEFGDKRRNDRRHITVAFRRLSRNFKKSSVFFFFSFSRNQTIFLKSIVSTTQRRKRRTMTRMFSENDTRTNLGNERYLER